MALTTPILNAITPFDATQAYTFIFSTSGGNQITQNNLVIQKVSDNTVVYNATITTFLLQHTVPANTLQNGVQYKAQIRVGDANNSWSNWSPWIVFYCFSPPVVQITNIINGTINNQTYTFTGSYTQAEGEKLQSYKFLLYDEHQGLLQISNELFDGALQYQFTGLQNNKTYYIKLEVITVNQMQADSGLVMFVPQYTQPKFLSALTLTNLEGTASIQVTANIIQIIGEVDSGTITYINNDWIDLTNGSISFQQGFNVDSDFTLKMWFKNVPTDGSVFLKILGGDGYINLEFYNNAFHAFKYLYNGGVVPHFVSNQISTITNNNVVFLWMQQINDLINLQTEILS